MSAAPEPNPPPLEVGLSDEQVQAQLKVYGKNVLEEENQSLLSKVIASLLAPISLLIFVAIIVTAALGDFIDMIVLLVLLCLNTTVHIIHEWKAGNIVKELKETLALKARVRRNGQQTEINAEDLVPQDIVHLETGDVIPADGTLIGDAGAYLLVDQSSLTGESLAVEKKVGDKVYSSTTVKRGESWCKVEQTGKDTSIGKTAQLTTFTKVSDNYKHVLSSINNFILVNNFLVCFIFFTIALFRNDNLLTTMELLIILTVSSLPIALPAVLTVTMAVGARELKTKGAIVTRLASVESLASVDILCTDKTGTLTYNRLSISTPFVFKDHPQSDNVSVTSQVSEESLALVQELLTAAALASERHHDTTKLDPIDQAISRALQQFDVPAATLDEYETIAFTPFDPVSKRVTAQIRHKVKGDTFEVSKGAPHVIQNLANGSITEEDKIRYDNVVTGFAKRGYRALGVAKKKDGHWHVLGILPVFDPPRDDSASTLREAQRLGLKVKMLTGDALAIAKETARALGMGQNIYDTSTFNLDEAPHPKSKLSEQIEEADGFSQIFPEHKYNVVDALQRRKHVVAVSGDGQNDTAALKKANVGIAVQGAVNSARAAASIVFLREGLSAIVDAIKLSRKIFVRMWGYAIYRIAHSLHLLAFVLLLYAIFSELFSTQLLIILAIFSDLSVLLIGFDNAQSGEQPEVWQLRQVFFVSLVLSVVLTAGTILWWVLLLSLRVSTPVAMSLLFLQVALTENQLIFSTRQRKSSFQKPLPSKSLLLTVLIVDALATVFVAMGVIVPAAAPAVWIVKTWLYSLGVFFIADIAKVSARSWLLHRSRKRRRTNVV